MTATVTIRTETKTVLTCDQCGTTQTFKGFDTATPGWLILFDPLGEVQGRLYFHVAACAQDWMKPRLEALRG